MRSLYIGILSILLVTTLAACGASDTVQTQPVVSTSQPQVQTVASTSLIPQTTNTAVEAATATAGSNSASGGLGFSISPIKVALQTANEFTFSDNPSGGSDYLGEPLITTAALSAQAVTKMNLPTAFTAGFSTKFYGTPTNIAVILIIVPASGSANTLLQAGELYSVIGQLILVANKVPQDSITAYITWLTQVMTANAPGTQTTTINNIKYTLTSDTNNITLEIAPAQ